MKVYNSFHDIDGQPYVVVGSEEVIEISDSFADLTGYSVDELLNKNIDDLFKILRVGPDFDIMHIEGEDDYFLFTKSLEVRFVDIKIIKEQDKEVYVLIEKPGSRLDEKLIFVEQTFKENLVGAAIFSVPGLILLKANQKYLDFMDHPFNKMKVSIGKPISEIVTGFAGSQAEIIWKTVLETQKISHVKENRHEKFARGITYWDSTQTPVFENGKMKYIFETAQEVTERVLARKKIEEQIEAIEDKTSQLKEKNRVIEEQKKTLEKAMEMKDEFLSLISHEFRTPLNVINTAIQTLSFVYADEMTDKVREYMGTIRQNTFRQLRLVNNLLDITRADAGRIKLNKKNIDIVFLTKAITESVYEYASLKGVRITFVSTLAKKVIGIDDDKYERIILNLLSNAIKFTPAGKSIVVSLRTIKGKVCVEVKDTGIGIPPNKIDVIFEKFGQVDSSLSSQAEGTGIGLSLVKKFAEALGGSVTVKSKVGKGTAFTVLLPGETVAEEYDGKPVIDLMSDSRLVQTTNVEFSDIYI